jgi:glycosyltransferase involved in cell wall biosynthesis
MDKKIKVIYDISVLGSAPGAGIYRVTKSLAIELSFCENIEVFFNPGIKTFLECKKFFEESGNEFGKYEYYKISRPFEFLLKSNKNIINFFSKKAEDSNSKIKVCFLKILRKVFLVNEKILFLKFDFKFNGILKNADIYYSPLHEVPEKVKKNKRIKKLIVIHDIIPIIYPQFFEKSNSDHYIKQLVDGISNEFIQCVSDSTKNDLLSYRKDLDERKVFVSMEGASESIFYKCENLEEIIKIKQKYNIPENSKYLLSLSTLEPRKNIDTNIRAFINLLNEKNISDLYLVLVGKKGWNYDKILGAVENSSKFKDKIILTGFVPDEDLAAIYSGSLAFVYMSFYEGFGLPPLEAMKCGTPVICAGNSSLPEVVGDAGFLLSETDEKGLSEKIYELYKNEKLRNELSEKSLGRSSLFSWKKTMDKTNDFFKYMMDFKE